MTPAIDRVAILALAALLCGLTACATPAQRAQVQARQAATDCLMQRGANPATCAQQLAALDEGTQCHVEKQTYDAGYNYVSPRVNSAYEIHLQNKAEVIRPRYC